MQFAVKRLTKSDLTFFEAQFRKLQLEARAIGEQGSKQKGINLNADVFVDILFPTARGNGTKRRFNLPLTIYGPGLKWPPQFLTRKVISAGGGGKNWRLNGELIPNPELDPTRYDQLAVGDLALIGVDGDAEPTAMAMVLLSRTDSDDSHLHSSLSGTIGNQGMGAIGASELEALAASAAPAHPIRELVDTEADGALEEAAVGSSEALRWLRGRSSPRRMTAEAFREARLSAEATGFGGEVLLNDWLLSEQKAGRISSFTWFADTNAINPWDFEIVKADGVVRRLEAKTTRGSFDRAIQISHAELEYAAEPSAPPTDLYRFYEFDGHSAKLAIASNFRALAREILDITSVMRPSVVPDGYTVAVHRFGEWKEIGLIEISNNEAD